MREIKTYLFVEVELVNEPLPHLYLHATIQSHIGIAMQIEEILKDVQDSCHLGENEHFMAL